MARQEVKHKKLLDQMEWKGAEIDGMEVIWKIIDVMPEGPVHMATRQYYFPEEDETPVEFVHQFVANGRYAIETVVNLARHRPEVLKTLLATYGENNDDSE